MPLFADLDRLRADLDALRPLAPEQEARVLQKFRLEWNYNSNAIEGNSLTLGETRSLLLHGLTAAGKPMRDHLDIKGHNEAVFALEDFVRSQYPLTEQFIREMHQLLLGEPYHTPAQTAGGQATRKLIMPGRYKTSPNNVLTATGEMFYFASPEETPGRMTDLVDWYRAEEAAPTLPPVALAAEFHYRFVRIHPFDDGNGRMSRLLMNLILLRHGYAMTVIKAEDRNRYLAALSEADAGEPEPFLRFIIENVEASLRLMIRAARGEAIDEPSDLDKKLALLKKQVASREDFAKATWNLETQRRFYAEVLKPCMEYGWHTLSKFNDLFFQTTITVDVRNNENRHVGEKKNISLYELMSAVEDTISQDILIGEVRMSFYWWDFRNILTPFNQSARLEWKFEKLKYKTLFSFSHSGHSIEAETNYYQPNNLNLANGVITQLANSNVDFIAAKLAEADTPPT